MVPGRPTAGDCESLLWSTPFQFVMNLPEA